MKYSEIKPGEERLYIPFKTIGSPIAGAFKSVLNISIPRAGEVVIVGKQFDEDYFHIQGYENGEINGMKQIFHKDTLRPRYILESDFLVKNLIHKICYPFKSDEKINL